MKIIRSVKDTRGNIIRKQPAAGIGQLRCSKCQNMCTTKRLPGGKVVMQCTACGANYVSSPMDGPKQARPGALPKRAPPRSARRS